MCWYHRRKQPAGESGVTRRGALCWRRHPTGRAAASTALRHPPPRRRPSAKLLTSRRTTAGFSSSSSRGCKPQRRGSCPRLYRPRRSLGGAAAGAGGAGGGDVRSWSCRSWRGFKPFEVQLQTQERLSLSVGALGERCPSRSPVSVQDSRFVAPQQQQQQQCDAPTPPPAATKRRNHVKWHVGRGGSEEPLVKRVRLRRHSGWFYSERAEPEAACSLWRTWWKVNRTMRRTQATRCYIIAAFSTNTWPFLYSHRKQQVIVRFLMTCQFVVCTFTSITKIKQLLCL